MEVGCGGLAKVMKRETTSYSIASEDRTATAWATGDSSSQGDLAQLVEPLRSHRRGQGFEVPILTSPTDLLNSAMD